MYIEDEPPLDATYNEILVAAVNDLAKHGFDAQERVDYWVARLKITAELLTLPGVDLDEVIRKSMAETYRILVQQGRVLSKMPGVTAYTLQRIEPSLHRELERRIRASADLIRINRTQAIDKTLQRFRGWATSIPEGGSKVIDKLDERKEIKKSLRQLPFEERRVLIDQGHKLVASIHATVAEAGHCLGGFWRSHKHQHGYNGRPDHNARDGIFYLARNSWAVQSQLVKAPKSRYMDSIEQPGELVFCRCYWVYVFSLRSIPPEFLTAKGERTLVEARLKAKADAS